MHPARAGGHTEQQDTDGRCMINRGDPAPHQLPRAPGCLSDNPGFWEDLERDYNSIMHRQCHNIN